MLGLSHLRSYYENFDSCYLMPHRRADVCESMLTTRNFFLVLEIKMLIYRKTE